MIDTYLDLKTAVADWCNREDLTDQIPQFIRLAESDIYRGLQCNDNEFIVTYTPTEWSIQGEATAVPTDGMFTDLPSNFSSIRQVTWNGVPLEPISDFNLKLRLAATADSAPKVFCIVNRQVLFSSEIPAAFADWDTDDELAINYWGYESLSSYPTWHVATNPVENPEVTDIVPEALTQADGNTTRMLQRNPEIYLEGSLYYAALFLRDVAAQTWGGLFQAHLAALKSESKRNRYAGGTKSVVSAY
jgi:hypothetical protein